jgi:hypothetical protein
MLLTRRLRRPWATSRRRRYPALFRYDDFAALVIATVGTDEMRELCHPALRAERTRRFRHLAVRAPARVGNGSAAFTLGDCHAGFLSLTPPYDGYLSFTQTRKAAREVGWRFPERCRWATIRVILRLIHQEPHADNRPTHILRKDANGYCTSTASVLVEGQNARWERRVKAETKAEDDRGGALDRANKKVNKRGNFAEINEREARITRGLSHYDEGDIRATIRLTRLNATSW